MVNPIQKNPFGIPIGISIFLLEFPERRMKNSFQLEICPNSNWIFEYGRYIYCNNFL
jgi:hypothetical protein